MLANVSAPFGDSRDLLRQDPPTIPACYDLFFDAGYTRVETSKGQLLAFTG
ncbi:MAG: hypothetical protein WBQ86_09365 [Candidatus Binatus sp.]